jgi:hypothetical protein
MIKAILAVGALMMATAATPAAALEANCLWNNLPVIKRATLIDDYRTRGMESVQNLRLSNQDVAAWPAHCGVTEQTAEKSRMILQTVIIEEGVIDLLQNKYGTRTKALKAAWAGVDSTAKTKARAYVAKILANQPGDDSALEAVAAVTSELGLPQGAVRDIALYVGALQARAILEPKQQVFAPPPPAPASLARPATPVVTEADPDALTCERYGYERGKLGFADCMMQLDMARRALEQADAQYARDKALYQEQLAAAEKERRRQLGLRQLEMGLGLLAGGGVRQPGATPSAPLAPPPPATRRTIRLPNGYEVICQTIGSYTDCH